MDIQLREVLKSGCGVSFRDAAAVRIALIRNLRRGNPVTLRFDTMGFVTDEFVAGILVDLDKQVDLDFLIENLRFRGFPLRQVIILETVIQSWLGLQRNSPRALRHPDAILKASEMIQ